jgi:dTDP-4-dehydrorhamnose 3,5-epimerase
MKIDPLKTPIDGLTVEPKQVFTDARGSVMHMLKSSEASFHIGEIYFSTVQPGVTKGWKRHSRMTQRFVVPFGEIMFQFEDDRPLSLSSGAKFSINLSPHNYQLITVPPGVWYSFKCVSMTVALIANATDIEHDPLESETRPYKQ